ncbi:MAG: PKD domain-containing protein [Bacteroidales bacterium]|nr:PKD domain-containing protein [Bacteroidales bacterium]
MQKVIKYFNSSFLKGALLLALAGYSTVLFAQVDTEFWFVVPEISHRGSTGGKPGTMRFATLELEATVTIEMPANPAFTPIVLDIPANDDAAVDLSHLIDDVPNTTITGLENRPLTPDGVNPFGLHITATNLINAYWEVNYIYGADIWTLKGKNGLGTLFYTPFQTEYFNHLTTMPSYSAIDVVATQDNTRITFTLPDGVGASFGEPMTSVMATTPGATFSIQLDQGETFSLFPYLKSTNVADRLAGTRMESNLPIAVVIKDDNLNTASQGRSTIGDQIVPVDIAGDTYVVPAMGNPNLTFVVATQDNTSIYIDDVLYTTLNEGEQVRIQSPNNQIIVISSKNNINAPTGPPIYVFHLALSNMTRGAALLPPIGCTGNTQLAFTRAREEIREKFYFFLITENENIDKFIIDGAPADLTIIPDDITQWDQLGNGWSAYMTANIPASKLAIGQHLVENTGGIFHLALMNGFTSANLGDMFYGYFSDYGGLNVGAVVAGTNSSVIRACYGTPVQLHAYGGTTYEWTPQEYLDDPFSNLPFAINLPAGEHEYVAHISGACGSGDVPLTVVVAPPVRAHFSTNVVSGCSPLTIHFEDQSEGNATWQYDLGDGTPLMLYDTLKSTITIDPPPDPFTFSHTYVNHTTSPISYLVTLMVKNSSYCADIITKTITVFPEIQSDFSVDPTIACDPLESYFTNLSTGDTATWLWEFGDGGSSTERDPVHVYRNLFGPDNLVFDATLVAISPYNCRDTSTRTVTVKPYIEAMFAYDTVAECSPHEIIITDQSIGADSYHWDFGDGATSVSGGPVLRHVYSNTGPVPVTYTITLDVANEEGCTDQIRRDVTIYPEVRAAFSLDPPEICSPAEVVFNNFTVGPPGTVYLWDFGDGGSSTEEEPVHRYDRNLLRHDTIFTVTLVAITPEDCRDTAIFDVVVHPFIEAAFTVNDVVGCAPFEIAIHNESIGVDNYYWEFGDGFTSTSGDPVLNHIYNNIGSTSEVYPLLLIVTNEEGCSDTMVRYVTVHPLITSNFSFNRDEGCHPLTVNFTDLSANAEVYLWDFGDGSATVEPSPVHTFTNFGSSDSIYTVTLTTSTADGECVKSISWDFVVHPAVEAAFTFPQAVDCGPFEVTFENLSIGGSEFHWDFGDDSTLTVYDTLPVTHTFVNGSFADEEAYEVILVAENEAGCLDTARKIITVYPDIESHFSASVVEGCHPLEVDFTDLSDGAQTYLWDFGDGTSSNLGNPSHIFTNTGTVDSIYTVTLTTIAPNNICRDTFSLDITVHPYVKADFSIPVQSGCTPFEVVIENSSVNAEQYHWEFGDGTDTVTHDMDPFTHRFTNPDFTNRQDFVITLTAMNYAGCTGVQTRIVTVEPAIEAGFSASRVEGCHPLQVDFANTSEGGAYFLWDFGDGTSSSRVNPSRTFTNLGSADVTYRVWLYTTASNNRCRDSVFKDIIVHPYISADFTFMESIRCSPSPVTFNNASVGGETYYWDFGDGTDTVTTDINPVIHQFENSDFLNNGRFQVTLTAESYAGCTDQITRTVELYPAIEAAFDASAVEGCHPMEVEFTNLSNGAYTYSWDFGDGASSSDKNPDYTFTNYTDDPVTREVHLTATSRYNCVSEAMVAITIHPKPKARFETDRIINCPPFDITISNTSLNADHYAWIFGDGDELATRSNEQVHHLYDNNTDNIVTYGLKLIASSDFGCTDSIMQNVHVYPYPVADFTANTEGCSPLTVYFTNASIRGDSYEWDFGDGTGMSTTDPANIYINNTDHDEVYYVSLTTTSQYGCVDIKHDTVFVYPQPIAEFIVSPTHQMFPSTTVSLENQTSPGPYTYHWNMGDGNVINQQNPLPHRYAEWGDYEINLVVSSEHCYDSASHSVRIFPAAPVAAFDTIYAGCEPLNVQFANYSVYGEQYLWDFDDGHTSTEFEPEHTFEKHGYYNVKLTVEGAGGRDYAYRQVEVYRNPVVDFRVAPILVMLPDQEVQLFNLTEHGQTYLWNFGDGNTSTEESPSHLYSEVGIYDIMLEVWTENMCTGSLTMPEVVTVRAEGSIVFPDAFKPDMDGPNGGYYDLRAVEKNNIFHPLWEGVDAYNLQIYTRWGELLFVSDDVNIGWDGYHDGTLSSQGVYVWKCTGTFVNGESFNLAGNVTLLYHNR